MTGTALVVWRQFRPKRNKPPKQMRTICEVIRELMRDAEARGDKLSIARLEEAYDMAKRMDRKLREYNPHHGYIVAGGGYIEKGKT